MKKYFLDTNIFLRTLIEEDATSFEDCFQVLILVKTNKIKAVTASLILAEVAWTLSSYYRFPKRKVVRALKSIINLRGLKIIDNYNSFISIELYSRKNVKYIDTLIASIKEIEAKKWVVISYDKDFDKLGLIRKEPKEIIKQN